MANWLKEITDSALAAAIRWGRHFISPRNARITKITIHHIAGVMRIENLLAFLATTDRQASYTYGIGMDGTKGQIVRERDRSIASSSRLNDNAAITLGVSNSATGGQWPISQTVYDSMIEFCVDFCRRNPGIVREDGKTSGLWYDGTPNASLTRHNMFTRTTCPGPHLEALFPQICKDVNSILDESEGLTMAQYEKIMGEIRQLNNLVDSIANVVMPRFNRISDLPEWARQEHIDAYNRGIIHGVKLGEGTEFDVVFSTPLSWKEVRSNVKAYRRERNNSPI